MPFTIFTTKMETDTVSLGHSSLVIGVKRESYIALVMAYSFMPAVIGSEKKMQLIGEK